MSSWELAGLRAARPREPQSRGTVICRTGSIGSLALVESSDNEFTDTSRTLTGTAAVFDQWQEVVDHEGHYFERIAPTAFAKTLSENGGRIPLLLDHGKHPQLGSLLLGQIEALSADAGGLRYTARLHDGVPLFLMEGLRSGQYGSSFRARPIKSSYNRRPSRSAWNPDQLMEVTRTELRLSDVGPTSLPAYSATEARLRSLTGAPEPRRRETAIRSADPEPLPAWQLQREDFEPAWLLRRRERRGRTYAKA
jgi:phage head maturation protease